MPGQHDNVPVQEEQKIDYLSQMPLHILDTIYDYLAPKDIFKTQFTCKNLYKFANSQCKKRKIEKDVRIIDNDLHVIPMKSFLSIVFPELHLAEPISRVFHLEGEKQLKWMSATELAYENSNCLRNLTNPAGFFKNVRKFTAVNIDVDQLRDYLPMMPNLENLVVVDIPLTEVQIYQIIQDIQLNEQKAFTLTLDENIRFSTSIIEYFIERTRNLVTRDMKLLDNDSLVAMEKAESYTSFYNLKVSERRPVPGDESEITSGSKKSELHFLLRELRRVAWDSESHLWI